MEAIIVSFSIAWAITYLIKEIQNEHNKTWMRYVLNTVWTEKSLWYNEW